MGVSVQACAAFDAFALEDRLDCYGQSIPPEIWVVNHILSGNGHSFSRFSSLNVAVPTARADF